MGSSLGFVSYAQFSTSSFIYLAFFFCVCFAFIIISSCQECRFLDSHCLCLGITKPHTLFVAIGPRKFARPSTLIQVRHLIVVTSSDAYQTPLLDLSPLQHHRKFLSVFRDGSSISQKLNYMCTVDCMGLLHSRCSHRRKA